MVNCCEPCFSLLECKVPDKWGLKTRMKNIAMDWSWKHEYEHNGYLIIHCELLIVIFIDMCACIIGVLSYIS